MLVTIIATRMPTKCPACLGHLAKGPIIVRCSECKIAHHGECLAEIGCASLNCNATSAAGGNTFNGRGGFIPEALLAGHPNPLAEAMGEGGYYSVNYDTGIGAWGLPCVSSGCYADLLDRCNYATLEAEFGGDPCTCDLTGRDCDRHPGAASEPCSFWHNGTFRVLQNPCACSDDNEPWDCERRAVEIMGALEEYPALDDSLYSEAECHDQDTQWDNWGRDDFIGQLEQESGLETENATEEQIDELRSLASEATGSYPEGSDDSLSFPYGVWVEWLAADGMELLREHGLTEPEPEPYSHPLRATEILSVSNSAYTKDVVSKLPQGRKDTPDTRRMIVRAVRGAMGKGARRSNSQRYYRRLAYHVALEFYLGRG